ncbi:ABC transporter permease subunit [Yinghuangia soli]|uniref:DUF1349 domain-containing protein n=1 Tax=Yinghuangia soli TaxID=2908204 RepID=A0AA41Q144_9ACTN|nr:ABC transporter permease subunit [Yinghuangia soli]MCF2529628.1 DUF1349 domain-containing protein [Yinghuangia soli]
MSTSAPAPPPPTDSASAPPAPYRSRLGPGKDGFGRLLAAEWTKLHSVRRWTVVLITGLGLTVLISLLSANGSEISGDGPSDVLRGPDGTTVSDSFRFVHQPLDGDGTVTVRVDRLVPGGGASEPGDKQLTPAPWAKAGLLVKASTKPGATYAAVMLTRSHGVRFQSDFVHDTAGSAAKPEVPRWLRLVRAGDLVTGYESADGVSWDKVGSTRLKGLPGTVEVGMFVASPFANTYERAFGTTSASSFPTISQADFGQFSVQGRTGGELGDDFVGQAPGDQGEAQERDGIHTVSASGDIAPTETDMDLVQTALSGAAIGLIPFAALGVLFITAEYRKDMIRTTFTVSPRRGRVLAAKSVVLSGTVFAVGVVAAAVSAALGIKALRDAGHRPPMFPDVAWTDGPALRAIVGTAAVLALVALLALGLGALLRNTAAAVTLLVVVMVLPQVLVSGLPLEVSRFIMRATPVAGFGVQDTRVDVPQVDDVCLPDNGCTGSSPWSGLLVLAAYTAVVLAAAAWKLRRRPV